MSQRVQKRKSHEVSSKQMTAQDVVKQQVSPNRREEIWDYLRLFGYKPERTILQVHVAGSFGQRTRTPTQMERKAATEARYGGPTFTVIGRTHDPDVIRNLIPPKERREEQNPGYLGYLFMKKDKGEKPPDELLPLDFVPADISYPQDWKRMFTTKGYLVAMHVPSNFARGKNEVHRRLRRIKGAVDSKKKWVFLDELKEYGYFSKEEKTVTT
jgi:hypothetical protein